LERPVLLSNEATEVRQETTSTTLPVLTLFFLDFFDPVSLSLIKKKPPITAGNE